MRRLALFAVIPLAAACARDADALHATQSRLGRIQSGVLAMRLSAAPGLAGEGHDVGFELRGPFDISRDGPPSARLDYTQLAGAVRKTSTFLSTGRQAFVEVAGVDYELPASKLQGFGGKAKGVAGLDIERWAVGPRTSPAGQADGVAVDRVTAAADPVRALNDVFAVAGDLGAEQEGFRRITGAAAEHLRRSVQSARMTVVTGHRDRLLRSLRLDIVLSARDREALRASLGDLAGARITLDLTISRPNRPVSIAPPTTWRPLSDLPISRT